MRRALVALMGTVAGTALLIGAKYQASTPQAAGAVEGTNGDGHGTSGSPSAADPSSASTSPSAGPTTSSPPVSASPPGGRSTTAKPTTTTSKPGTGPTGGGATQPPATTPAATCTTASGAATAVVKPGEGSVVVTIKVCNGAVTSSTGSLSSSNWEPQNTNAMKSLNQLAVQYYKTDVSKITFSGATLTSNAYKTSLKSAMSKAGI